MNIFSTINAFINKFPDFVTPLCYKVGFCFVTFIIIRQIIIALTPIVQEICKKNELDYHTCHILNKLMRYTMITLGSTIALQNIGIEVSMIIATFGITGIVLSYGMKDIVSNFIAGILIMSYKHIKINDHISIALHSGKVVDMNLRYVTLQTTDTTIFVPNIVLYTQIVSVENKK